MNRRDMNMMTRREVLAALAALGVGITRAGAAGGKAGLKVGCSTVCFRKSPLREAMERIHRAGFEYFETQATGPWCPHVDSTKDDPAQLRSLTKEFGFKGITALWSLNGAIISNAKSVESITRCIQWAKEAGIPVVNAGDGWKTEKMSEDDAFKVLSERLAAILEVAEKCQVCLAIEPHGTFSMTPEGLRKILGLSKSRWLGINFDTANVHRVMNDPKAGGYTRTPFGNKQNEVETLKAIVDRVVHVHVKDVVGSKCTVLGQGEVNIQGCLRVLKEHGYNGVVSVETEGEFDADEGQRLIEGSRKYLVECLAKS